MYVLILCSIVSLTIIVERFLFFKKKSHIKRAAFMQLLQQELKGTDIKKGVSICQNANTPFASVMAAGLSHPSRDEKSIAAAMEREMVIQISQLERFIDITGTIGSTAVYIGLLGTVWGIIKAFQDIARAGSGGINVVIGGISEALVCTAAGLLVAVPAVIAYNYFVRKINDFSMDMELCISEIADWARKR